MKQIKIITRHSPSNYGSLLQSMATAIIMERLGYNCQIIDYQRKDERGIKAILAQIHNKKEWSKNPLKKIVYILLRFPMEYRAQYKFDHMRLKTLKLTQRCNTIEQLAKLKSDIFITGSDQVWGPVLTKSYDEAYFLSFVDKKAKKIAYSASFGRTQFTLDIIESYKKFLSDYDKIAVREDSALKLLNEWNIPCSGQVFDPTLLLNNNEWSKFITKKINNKYVLVYQLHSNKDLDEYAKNFSREVGLPLLRISPSFHQIKRGGKFVYLPDWQDFLSYIKNCTYMITDSFHGTAFAINFNKQFIEILPNNKTGSRNQSILQLTNLTDRIITNYSDFSIKDKFIDYSKVNNILERERTNSIDLLTTMIED